MLCEQCTALSDFGTMGRPCLARPWRRDGRPRPRPWPSLGRWKPKLRFPPLAAMSLSDFKPPIIPNLNLPSLWWLRPGSSIDGPTKERLVSVQDFFKYTELESKRFFDELDRNGDGRVTLDDLRVAIQKRNLPVAYAKEFIEKSRGHWWESSVGWDEFKRMVCEREAEMLRAYTSLEVNPAGHLEAKGIKGSLLKLGLPATDENAQAMLRALGRSPDGYVSYASFRNFLILLPKHQLQKTPQDLGLAWYESATMMPIGTPAEQADVAGKQTAKMLLTAALAGALASGSSTFLMHPVDTLKTRVQSLPGATIRSVAASIPELGGPGLYRGVVPAVAGAGASHGLRTCAYEAMLAVGALFGQSAGLQMQGLASGVGTLLGTAVRIPCEVLKQRLQVGRHAHVQQALAQAVALDGWWGLFRGTGATLSREVPFYVLGMVGYEWLKGVFRGEVFGGRARELGPLETVGVGALSGALAAVATTPADVMKTRIMTLAPGQSVNVTQILIDILQKEGPVALFKGALPRAVWIAPLGAMNFAGYELAKNALNDADASRRGRAKRHQPAPAALPQPVPTAAAAAAEPAEPAPREDAEPCCSSAPPLPASAPAVLEDAPAESIQATPPPPVPAAAASFAPQWPLARRFLQHRAVEWYEHRSRS